MLAFMKPIKPWIKGGIIGAIAYPILDTVVFLWGMACGYATEPGAICDILEWWYFHVSAYEWPWMDGVARAIEHIVDPFFLVIAIDIVIGFVLGTLIALGIRKLRKKV